MRTPWRFRSCLGWLAALGAVLSAQAALPDGEAVYRSTCSTCHDSGAGNAPRIGRAQEWKERFASGRAALQEAAIVGIPNTAMAAKGGFGHLDADEVRAAVDYMLLRSGYVDPVSVRPRAVTAPVNSAPAAMPDVVITARVAATVRARLSRPDAPIDTEGDDLVVRGVGVRIGTVRGVVRLMGVVPDAATIRRAEALVRAVDGVLGVDNRLVSGGMLDFD